MNTQPRLVAVESIADLPIIWSFIRKMDLVALLDQHFPTTPRWKGPLTVGEVLAVWLLFILSESDHRLSHVEPWVEQHQRVLTALVGKTILATDFHDDRLADCLDRLAEDGVWADFEQELNQHTLRVYSLPTAVVRIDTTTANSYAEVVSESGLLQFGHSKDDASRPQLKIATAILDPLGMPLATTVLPGNTADDPVYVPTIQTVQKSLGCGGKLYVGDCKMAALATRAYVASTHDIYLCPLSENQLSRSERRELLQPVWSGEQTLQRVFRPDPDGQDTEEFVAEGFGVDVSMKAEVEGQEVSWKERRWLVRSQAYAHAQEAALDRRLEKAEAAILELTTRKQGKKRLSESDLHEAMAAILTRNRVQDLISSTVQTTVETQWKRAYGNRPATEETTVSYTLETRRNEAAIAALKREMGWQVYAMNSLEFHLNQVVWAYRGQYRIENDWSRLKGRPLGLTPLYIQNENRLQGLVLVLSLCLRVLTLVEWVVREELKKTKQKVKGVYAGQPGRQTATPSAELLLSAMKAIRINVVEVAGQFHVLMASLSVTQQRLLELWGLPTDLYEQVLNAIPKSP